MTRFHLVRHGAHAELGRVLSGRGPIALSAEGARQAEALAAHFADLPIAALHTSPLPRTRQTAAPIAARLGLLAEPNEALNEVDFGAWSGQSFAALDNEPHWRAWNLFRSTAQAPGGERMVEVQARMLAEIARLHARHPQGEVVLVSHGDVLRATLVHFLGMPLDLLARIEIGPASVSVIEVGAENARVLLLNGMPAQGVGQAPPG